MRYLVTVLISRRISTESTAVFVLHGFKYMCAVFLYDLRCPKFFLVIAKKFERLEKVGSFCLDKAALFLIMFII